jgi:hypothetical protein
MATQFENRCTALECRILRLKEDVEKLDDD